MTDFRFRELVDSGWLLVNDGYRAKVDELGGGGALFLRAGALQDDGFRWRGLDSFTPGAKIESKRGHSGDVVITTKGNSVGRVGWVPESAPDFVYSPHLSFWRSLDEKHVVPRYLYYWSRSPVFAAQVRNLAFGTDMAPYLSLRDQLELRIDLPEAAEQRRIAGVLGALDDLIGNHRSAVSAAVELAKAVLLRASTGGEVLLKDVATVRRGLSYKGDGLADQGMPMVNMGSAANFGWLKRDGWKYYVGDYKPHHVAHAGDLIITNTEQTWRQEIIGWPMLVPSDVPDVLFTHHTYRVDFDADHRWLTLPFWAFLFTDAARARLDGAIRGTTVANLPADAVENLSFSPPSPDDGALKAARALLEEAWASEVAVDELTRSRDELLPLLMSGRVRVREVA